MDELVRWLGEQLDKDAARAEAARSAEFCKDGHWLVAGPFEEGLGSVQSVAGEAILGQEESVPFALADHIAAHDPDRVLLEVDAKRQLLARYEELRAASKEQGLIGDVTEEYQDFLLRLLALPYADRPGYREEWRP